MSIPKENTSILLLYNLIAPYSDIWVNGSFFKTNEDLNKSIIAF